MSDAAKACLCDFAFCGCHAIDNGGSKNVLSNGRFEVTGYCIFVLPMQFREEERQTSLPVSNQIEEHHHYYYQSPRGYAATKTRYDLENGTALVVRRLER